MVAPSAEIPFVFLQFSQNLETEESSVDSQLNCE